MPRLVLATGTAQPDPRSWGFDMRGLHSGWHPIGRQLSKNSRGSHSGGLFGRLQAGFRSEHPDNRNPSGFQSAGFAKPDLAAFLPRTAGEQFPLFRPATGLRALRPDLQPRVHNGGWNLGSTLSLWERLVVDV